MGFDTTTRFFGEVLLGLGRQHPPGFLPRQVPLASLCRAGGAACSHVTLVFPNDINYSDVHASALTYLEVS